MEIVPNRLLAPWEKAYSRCAKASCATYCGVTVLSINDSISNPNLRALLVNATWAALGYVVNQSPAAVRLARKAGFEV